MAKPRDARWTCGLAAGGLGEVCSDGRRRDHGNLPASGPQLAGGRFAAMADDIERHVVILREEIFAANDMAILAQAIDPILGHWTGLPTRNRILPAPEVSFLNVC